MNARISIFLSIIALAATGCASSQHKRAALPKGDVALMGVAQVPVQPAQMQAPAVAPTSAPVQGAGNPFANEPVPLVTPTKIQRVVVKPHFDAKGNMVPEPQLMYVVTEQAQFNPAALKSPYGTYIPPENIQNLPGNTTYSVSRTAVSAGSRGEAPQPIAPRHLQDAENTIITGLVSRSQEAEARAMAASSSSEDMKYFASFDEDLGWLLLPEAVLEPISRPTDPVAIR